MVWTILQSIPFWSFPPWVGITTVVALCSFFLVVLMDMASRAMGMQPLQMWVKSEYLQVGVTFLIIIFAGAMVTAGYAVMGEVTSTIAAASGNQPFQTLVNTYVDPFTVAKDYLTGTLISCQEKVYYTVASLDLFVEPMSTVQFEVVSVEAIGGGFAFGGFTSLFHYLGNGIIYLTLFNYVQYFLLIFCQYTMLPLFLPIGLALRAFPFTRGAGGLIVAFSLGFAFVFPMTYMLTIAMMSDISSTCNQVASSAPAMSSTPCFNNRGCIEQVALELGAKTGAINQFSDASTGLMSLMYMQAFFYPLIALIMTFTFIRQTSSLFGADLAEIGRGIVKII